MYKIPCTLQHCHLGLLRLLLSVRHASESIRGHRRHGSSPVDHSTQPYAHVCSLGCISERIESIGQIMSRGQCKFQCTSSGRYIDVETFACSLIIVAVDAGPRIRLGPVQTRHYTRSILLRLCHHASVSLSRVRHADCIYVPYRVGGKGTACSKDAYNDELLSEQGI